MSVSTGRTGGANPTDSTWKEMILKIVEAISADQDVYIGETAPLNPEPGDVWYKPSEDRYYHYVEA